MYSILSTKIRQPSGKLKKVVLCESYDQRILRIAYVLKQKKICHVVLLGEYEELEKMAAGYNADIKDIEVIDYEKLEIQNNIQSGLKELNDKSDFDTKDPVVAGAWLVRTGLADAAIAGAASRPAHVMRIFLNLIGLSDGAGTMSGFSLLMLENCSFMRNKMIGMSDVSVIPEPTPSQLSDIAIQSANTFEKMTGEKPKVAFLSFSTLGSSNHQAALKIREAVEITKKKKIQLDVDGELQIDAALIPSIAGTKSPSSRIAGEANVIIYPNLSAGNIALKIFQMFSKYRVAGPFLQGLKHSCTYIPRASSAENILEQIQLMNLL